MAAAAIMPFSFDRAFMCWSLPGERLMGISLSRGFPGARPGIFFCDGRDGRRRPGEAIRNGIKEIHVRFALVVGFIFGCQGSNSSDLRSAQNVASLRQGVAFLVRRVLPPMN